MPRDWLGRSLQAGDLGKLGERKAEEFLSKAGYKLLYRNFRPRRGGEVDLVFRTRSRLELVFVEVKTRSSERFGQPAEAVTWEQQRRIVGAADEWLSMLEVDEVTARFDIVEVLLLEGTWSIRHIPDAFKAGETRHLGSQPVIPGATRGDVLPRRAHGGAGRFPPRRRRY